MINESQISHHKTQLTCEICDCPLSYAESLLVKSKEHPLCNSFDCKRIMNQKPSLTPAMFKLQSDFQKKRYAERLEKDAARKQRIEAIKTNELNENLDIYQKILSQHPELSENNNPLILIPTGLSDSCETEKSRIDNYTEHLKNIVKQAAEYTDISQIPDNPHPEARERFLKIDYKFSNNSTLREISDRLCGMCKGACCTMGKDHAYLSAHTIRRYMDAHPELSEKEVLDVYLNHVDNESINTSCINQTLNGCSLPQEMRSDVCNGFYCETLKSYHKNHHNETHTETVVAIQRANIYWSRYDHEAANHITHAALVEKNRIRFLDMPLPDKNKTQEKNE